MNEDIHDFEFQVGDYAYIVSVGDDNEILTKVRIEKSYYNDSSVWYVVIGPKQELYDAGFDLDELVINDLYNHKIWAYCVVLADELEPCYDRSFVKVV